MTLSPRTSLASFTTVLVLTLTACGGATTSSSTTTPPVTPPATAKAPIHGLVSMNSETFNTNLSLTPDNSQAEPNANPDVYTATVILVTWKQLQPTRSSSLDTSAIESGLASVATYNTAHPTQSLQAKLRIFAGLNSPTWALNLDGPPVTYTDPNTGQTGSIPRYWTANYQAAWTSLQNQLAAVYDKDPRIQEVAVSGCASTTAEPFIHNVGGSLTTLLQSLGYTDAQYQSCLSKMATQYAAWTVTPLDYTFNAFNAIDSGHDIADTTFPIQVMTAWRSQLGTARGILANHGLQPTLTPDATPLYAEFTTLGPPLEFQTYGPTVDWPSTIAYGLTFHPSEIEIWPTTQSGGQAVISLTELQQWAAKI
jgi:hypothetical protein